MTKYRVNNPQPGNCKLNLTGQRFGMLVVDSYFGLNKTQNKLWLCKCDCGKEVKVITTELKKGSTTSCKCMQYRKGSYKYNYKGFRDITGSKWNSIVQNARVRNLEFTITKEDVHSILKIQGDKCAVSGLPISFADKTASVDRIENSIGYHLSNIHMVHKDVNFMRNKFTLEYYREMCLIVADNIRGKV